ncbi:hypothetical protein JHD49_07545 [Sulfurimonas sp. SAG-AH-194-C21]|nr:hypothetical protein [Sulfurimonas sp. SAG-AH-194-C21]MDF1883784.1 hypothetical protein [Sulfurimonas sp. SAG-AH-194-C21]
MRLENVLALTHAKLLNKPFVSNFTDIVFDVKNVKRGDLFLAFDESKIEDAILNGAYGIVFSKPTQITDSEIAWIKVQSLEDALKRLLRFKLLDKDIKVYETNEIVLKLALQVITEPSFIAISGNILDIAKQLWNIEDSSCILFCPNLSDKDIFTKTIELSNTTYKNIDIIEQTLFETSFIYNDVFYERQLISPFFIPYLEILLHLFKNIKVNYRLRKFTPIGHFEAVFTNKRFEIKEFGTSDKVLIFEKNSTLVESQITFLQSGATWAKIVYVVPHHDTKLIEKIQNKESLIIYKNKNEILNSLKEYHFHFALVLGTDKSILEKHLNLQMQPSLFDFK